MWPAITDPEQLQRWYFLNTSWRLSALQIGGKLSIYDAGTNADTFTHIIEVLNPPHHLVLRAMPGTPEMQYDVTGYRLEEEKGGARLPVSSSGYDRADADIRHQNMEQNAFGFCMVLENLHAYINGSSLPYPHGLWRGRP